MQNDLISRSALLEAMPKEDFLLSSLVRKCVVNVPAVDAAPVRHGRWESNEIPESMLSKCSECGITYGAYSFNYCPNCGAKMDAEVEG